MPKLLLITFIDFGTMKSGSSVRPQRIYEAFKKLGFEVNLLSGMQNRRRERWKNVIKKLFEIRKNLPDLCYIEPPSGPFFNFCDHILLIYIKLKGVPVGLFYRDAYWLLAEWWQVKGIKAFFLKLMHRFDLFVFKRTCKVVFFPSESMEKLFRLPVKSILPPAGVDMVTDAHPLNRNVLYIGGVSSFYGTDLMLKAFEIINETLKKDLTLTVVCRENEMGSFFEGYKDKSWLKIFHASGDENLRPFYEQCDAALYPSRRDAYMDLCMPVKLFEYLSRGLPVICTSCKEASGFVKAFDFGVICEDTAEDIAQKTISLFEQPDYLKELRENAIKALRRSNLWEHRAAQAAKEIGTRFS